MFFCNARSNAYWVFFYGRFAIAKLIASDRSGALDVPLPRGRFASADFAANWDIGHYNDFFSVKVKIKISTNTSGSAAIPRP